MDFLNGLTEALGSLTNELVAALVELFNLIVQVFQFLWDALVAVANFLLTALKAVGDFFVHLWNNFFKGIFTSLFDGIRRVTAWLESHLRPIIDFLKKARAYFDQLYKTYIAPFIKAIQHIRQFLALLRALHINIANGLDNFLGQVQRDVQQAFFQVRAILNGAIDLLNIVADPTMLLRRPTLLLSTRRIFNALVRNVTGLPPGYFFPSPRANAPHGLGFLPANFNASDPAHNPPASYYLGLDSGVPSFDFLQDGETIADNAGDDVGPLDFYDASAWPGGTCADVENCIREAAQAGLGVS